MKKNSKAGQPLATQKQTLQHLDANDPRLHHAAARSDHRHSRYGGEIKLWPDSIGTPPPPPPPPPSYVMTDPGTGGDSGC